MTATHPEFPTMALDTHWKLKAACREVEDSDIFYSTAHDKQRAAKRFCVGCPVRPDCLEYALLTDQYGIWGGMSERERDKKFPLFMRESMREDYNF
jgi:WhiB family redox-sensing transcriptional regulator